MACGAPLEGCRPCRRPYPKEFHEDVIRVARASESSVALVAKNFGLSESCLHRWLAEDDIERGERPGVTTGESAELRELRRKNRVLEMEVEILNRASAYFARGERAPEIAFRLVPGAPRPTASMWRWLERPGLPASCGGERQNRCHGLTPRQRASPLAPSIRSNSGSRVNRSGQSTVRSRRRDVEGTRASPSPCL